MSKKSVVIQLLLLCSICVIMICFMLWKEIEMIEDVNFNIKFWSLSIMSTIFYTGAMIVFSRIKDKNKPGKK